MEAVAALWLKLHTCPEDADRPCFPFLFVPARMGAPAQATVAFKAAKGPVVLEQRLKVTHHLNVSVQWDGGTPVLQNEPFN